tara:strand:+ start:273 stop:497 length:225 start_codon:yes stop_codon:yes gene_type:complete
MMHSNGKKNDGMSFEELITELKRLRVQMRYFREIQRESEILDAEYYQITKMQKQGKLTLFDYPKEKRLDNDLEI